MGRSRKSRGFRNDRELAEVATFGVCMMLDLDEPYIAAIVQPVASAAWRVVLDGTGSDKLTREAKRARRRLRRSCWSGSALVFLDAVITHAKSRPDA